MIYEKCARVRADDLKGCAFNYVAEARRLISQGKVEETDSQLSSFEKHLKEYYYDKHPNYYARFVCYFDCVRDLVILRLEFT